jgi:hypothetical protein
VIHDDYRIKILAGSATIVGDEERLMLSGVIEIPARCVVRIVRLEEMKRLWNWNLPKRFEPVIKNYV